MVEEEDFSTGEDSPKPIATPRKGNKVDETNKRLGSEMVLSALDKLSDEDLVVD
jgi:hypothetical protein